MKSRECTQCKKDLQKRHQLKFCSNKCQIEYRYNVFIDLWKKDSSRVSSSRNISKHIKKFLINKNKEKCSKCGWNERNKISGNIPLEVDHIDGNAGNNSEDNLRLLCPNCHALTPHFRNLNRGNGRKWRLNK